MKRTQGTFTISLDFELFWGKHDRCTYAECEDQMVNTRSAIPRILNIFEQYDIHATWATVGILFNDPSQANGAEKPSMTPEYVNQNLSPYRFETWPEQGETERTRPGMFAGSLIKLIGDTEGQEIGSHTYSHYYCLERGQSLDQFRSDLTQAKKVAELGGYRLQSLVFPRNQYTQQHISVADELGFSAIRIQDKSSVYHPRNRHAEGYMCRLLRGIDAFLPLTGNNVNEVESFTKSNSSIQLPASRFLRPWSPSQAIVDPLHLIRIKRSMTQAAKSGKNFHLWWHPHNVSSHTEKNLARLDEILDHFSVLKAEFGFQSKNMSELVEQRNPNRDVTPTDSPHTAEKQTKSLETVAC